MGKFLFFIFAIFGLVLFFSPQKASAATSGDVVINEVMPNPVSGEEWIELYSGTDFTLADYTIEDNTAKPKDLSVCSIVDGYLTLKKGTGDCKFGFELNNNGDIITLKKGNNIIDRVIYGNWVKPIDVLTENAPAPLAGESIARIPNGQDTNNDKVGFVVISTPTLGTVNVTLIDPDPKPDPDPVTPMASTDLKTELNKSNVIFTWENADTQKLDFEIIVTDKDGAAVIDHEPPQDLTKMEYKTTLDWGSYTWSIIAKNSAGIETKVDGSEFELVQPVYSKNIIVNEVSPHPSNGTDNESIELYNAGSEDVDLEGWFLDDIASGGSTPYEIPEGKIIPAGGYLVFYKTETKLSLNDTGDSARLLFPDSSVASACSFSAASIDLAWARDKDLKWSWTEKITPGLVNNIYLTPEKDDPAVNTDEEEVVINSVPISIKSGDYRDYSNKLVKLTGTIISTSGNTFYLDDGSGQAKIYIQDKTGIKKPPMHKGDIFEIFGIVNLYRNSWRVLPQKQTDVKLIKCIKDVKQVSNPVNKSSTSSATKTSATVVKTAQARAPDSILPIIKEVKAAEISPVSDTKDSPKNSLGSFAKVLIGLGVIFLILLVIKVRSFKSIRVIGGHFGEDET